MFKRLTCFLYGHVFDWDEYYSRLEKEGHLSAGIHIYCSKCNKYIKLNQDMKDDFQL